MFLLDTNVISELERPTPNEGVIEWFASTGRESAFLSVVSVAEIRRGVEQLAAGRRKSAFERWLDVDLPAAFGDRILPVTIEFAHGWGRLMSRARRGGIALSSMDAFLAATANHHGLTLVSRHSDLVPFCDRLFNPFNT